MPLIQDYNKLFEQNSNITKIYNNGNVVWPIVPSYTVPFYVENITNEDETLSITKTSDILSSLKIEYSIDNSTWETLGTTSTATALTRVVAPGERIYLRCNAYTWGGIRDTSMYVAIGNVINGISKVGGNIMSLLYGGDFTGRETNFKSWGKYNFCILFENNTNLVDASELLLPATTLTEGCYRSMFDGCTSLTAAPALPATTLANSCYLSTFRGCTSLTSAPALPATTLANGCYAYMFGECTRLTTAPALPATTLAEKCYDCMFERCYYLTSAPILPATVLVKSCYSSMFEECHRLNNVTCLATTNIDTDGSTSNWLYNASDTGTFTKKAGTTWPTGVNGILRDWTVVEV